MKLGIVVVHYQTPGLAAECFEALGKDLAASALLATKFVVDNGSDAAGQTLLASLDARLLAPGANLGFAAGANLGVRSALLDPSVEAVVVMNPDVFVEPGCLGALAAELERGAAAAGPQFSWDRGGRMLLPPTERRTPRDELRAALAARGRRAGAARAHWRRHARAHWTSRAPFATPWLSGGLLAIRRDAWEAVGGFDEGYQLYFEETDWLLRLARAGLSSWLVPSARAVHLYAQSALAEPAAQTWFEESADRFRRRFYGEAFAARLAALAPARDGEGTATGGRSTPSARSLLPALPETGLDLAPFAKAASGGDLWIEVSPTLAGYPAAGERCAGGLGSWRLADDVAARLPAGRWSVQLTDAAGRELGRWALAAGEPAEGAVP